ncbi:L-lactate MFS transporter [Coleofasciculus sp. G2-EDA-02]|uniref:L-lactate MFS transporter n=1 Tax=Coleofasciculus sp. G2-EDA-02 TaxID=3069529 RepID=UPI0032FBCD64
MMDRINLFEFPDEAKPYGLQPELGRWLFIPLGLIVLLCLGTVYSWSIFSGPFEEELNTQPGAILLPFLVLGVTFTIVMPITGLYMNRCSPRILTGIGGIIVGIGYLLSSQVTNLPLLVISYGLITGIGVGMTYGVPLVVAARWFPDRKGFAVGMTVVGFGLSPLLTAPLAFNLIRGNAQLGIPSLGIRTTFIILGIAFTAIILVISTTLKMPPPRWKPAGWTPPETGTGGDGERDRVLNLPMVQTQTFYGLWSCYIIGTFVGLTAIATTAQIGLEIAGLEPEALTLAVPLFAVFNGIGRPLFGWLNDRLKPKLTIILINVLILIASIIMLNTSQGEPVNFLVAFSLFWFCLGAWLAVAPAATLSFFHLDNYPSNYGLMFTAFGIGGLAGIFTAGGLKAIFGSFAPFFWVTSLAAIAAIIVATFLLDRPRKTAIADVLFQWVIRPISPVLLSLVEFLLVLSTPKPRSF